jgi:hypothetical protein
MIAPHQERGIFAAGGEFFERKRLEVKLPQIAKILTYIRTHNRLDIYRRRPFFAFGGRGDQLLQLLKCGHRHREIVEGRGLANRLTPRQRLLLVKGVGALHVIISNVLA